MRLVESPASHDGSYSFLAVQRISRLRGRIALEITSITFSELESIQWQSLINRRVGVVFAKKDDAFVEIAVVKGWHGHQYARFGSRG